MKSTNDKWTPEKQHWWKKIDIEAAIPLFHITLKYPIICLGGQVDSQRRQGDVSNSNLIQTGTNSAEDMDHNCHDHEHDLTL